ncbi:MAG: CPBP family intramembrane metalloprotease [Porphyrobacter sp.]|nr:CPBP family intramembrane metalloprotease [Porphyrobacter sp.]
MTGQVTSPGLARSTLGEWRAFGTFLRHPVLPRRVTGIHPAAIAATLKLFALDLVIMAVLIGVVALATALGMHIPENAIDKLQLGPLWLAIIVVMAPIAEELAFRSWLSGRPGHVTAIIALAVGVAIPVISGPQGHPVLLLGSLSIAIVIAIGLAIWLRKHPPMPFFSRHFAWFYAAASLLFALAHLSNYTEGTALILLPLVVPQLLVGLILGYARVTYGLWSDMLLHMLHNGLLIGLVLLQQGHAG